jgi:hypothetical protein
MTDYRSRILVARGLAVGCLALFVTGAARQTAWTEQAQLQFIERHWQTPLPRQGPPSAGLGPFQASLDPDRCGVCHPAQYEAWKGSLHAASMGPGVSGQLIELHRTDPAQARQCYTCHAPLAEQRPGEVGHDSRLTAKGIVCASCHVRQWQWYGPPRRDGSLGSETLRSRFAHHGVTRTPAFLRSEFCRDCHQFGPGGLALNGKLLQNTYEEWRAGPTASAKVQCQDCHMPDRRHAWHGIHDPDTVRNAIGFALEQGEKAVTLTITNKGGGHLLPTYVTPRLVVSGEMLDDRGATVDGSRRESIIGRAVTLDLSKELFDTRLAPGQSAVFRYGVGEGRGERLRLMVVVEPDHFYTRFFEALLRGSPGRGEAQIRRALEAAKRSAFTIYQRDVVIASR